MISSIKDAIDFEGHLLREKFILTVKDDRSDLGFVFGEIISNFLKKNYALVIINFAQSCNHYSHLFSKFGINVKSFRESNKISVIDVLSETKQFINPTSAKVDEHMLEDIHSINDVHALKFLYNQIERTVNELCALPNAPDAYMIFIDEINVLLNVGHELKAIHPFVQYCQALCSATEFPGILLVGGISHHNDEESKRLINCISHMADTIIHVEGLATGYSTVAHGKILMQVKNKSTGKSTSEKVLFKVEDKGAKLLPFSS